MAGIAPLSGSTTTASSSGISGAQPVHAAPATPPRPETGTRSFTAFPTSYVGFGSNGTAFGTLSVVDGKLSVVSAATAPAAGSGSAPAASSAPAPASAQMAAQTTAASAVPPATVPGSLAPSDPSAGLLGSAPTNPIVIQAVAQERAAAAAAGEEAAAAAAAAQADQVELQQIDAQIAAAKAEGDAAAVAALEPKQSAVIGNLQGQTFSGLGQVSAKSLASPEIPTVFLNIAS